MGKIPVAILGATGTVGQKLIRMLENHAVFEVKELVASARSTGKRYADAMEWREEGDVPEAIKDIEIIDYKNVTATYALSSLPSGIAKEAELFLCENGVHVVSNASTYRMDSNTPLIIPEVNAEHLSMLESQSTKGKLITNPNCATVFLTLGLAPLLDIGQIQHVSVFTMQAISGAGYPGVSSFDILGNTIPFIGNEEDKLENEAKKILGKPGEEADFEVTVHVNRVPVVHGHSVVMHVTFEEEVDVEEVKKHYHKKAEENPELYKIYTDDFRPQPLRDITAFDQRAHIGRIKQGAFSNVIGLLSMGHNLVRGAAGAAILNLELLHKHLS